MADKKRGKGDEVEPEPISDKYSALVDAFYSRFILRDFFGKIIPGIVFLISISLTLISKGDALWQYRYISNGWIWIIYISIAWFIGLGLQTFGNNCGITLDKPIEINRNKRESVYDLFKEYIKGNLKNHNERFVVIKEALGNCSVSLIFSIIFFTINCNGFISADSIFFDYVHNDNIFQYQNFFMVFFLIIFFIIHLFIKNHEIAIMQWNLILRTVKGKKKDIFSKKEIPIEIIKFIEEEKELKVNRSFKEWLLYRRKYRYKIQENELEKKSQNSEKK